MMFEASMDKRIFFWSYQSTTCSLVGRYRRFGRYAASLLQGIRCNFNVSVCLDGTGKFRDFNFNEMIILKMIKTLYVYTAQSRKEVPL